jgi:creatinine amidohydrolase
MTSAFISEMTSEAMANAAGEDAVVVIPMGSTELEGPHLPLGVDTIVAGGIARRLNGEPGVVIGPTLPIGYSKWFLPFAGTISLETETLIRVLTEYVQSLLSAGFRRFVFLNAHKGNNACIESASRSLVARHRVRIAMLSLWKLAHDLCAVKDGAIAEGRFSHAGEIMTSAVMALAPATVVSDRIAPDAVKSPENSGFTVKNSLGETEFMDSVQIVFQDIRDVTDSGTMGDPTAASAEKGEAVVERIAAYARAFLKEFQKLPLK